MTLVDELRQIGTRFRAMELGLYDDEWVSVPETDWARLAAFIDGEGCVSIFSRARHSEATRHQLTERLSIP